MRPFAAALQILGLALVVGAVAAVSPAAGVAVAGVVLVVVGVALELRAR